METINDRYSTLNILASTTPSLISSSILAPLNRLKILYQTKDLLFKNNINYNAQQLIISKFI